MRMLDGSEGVAVTRMHGTGKRIGHAEKLVLLGYLLIPRRVQQSWRTRGQVSAERPSG